MNCISQDVSLLVTLSAMMVTIVNEYLQCFYVCQYSNELRYLMPLA